MSSSLARLIICLLFVLNALLRGAEEENCLNMDLGAHQRAPFNSMLKVVSFEPNPSGSPFTDGVPVVGCFPLAIARVIQYERNVGLFESSTPALIRQIHDIAETEGWITYDKPDLVTCHLGPGTKILEKLGFHIHSVKQLFLEVEEPDERLRITDAYRFVKSSIDRGFPVLVCSYLGGHAFIVDGYRKEEPVVGSEDLYFHVLWGWGTNPKDGNWEKIDNAWNPFSEISTNFGGWTEAERKTITFFSASHAANFQADLSGGSYADFQDASAGGAPIAGYGTSSDPFLSWGSHRNILNFRTDGDRLDFLGKPFSLFSGQVDTVGQLIFHNIDTDTDSSTMTATLTLTLSLTASGIADIAVQIPVRIEPGASSGAQKVVFTAQQFTQDVTIDAKIRHVQISVGGSGQSSEVEVQEGHSDTIPIMATLLPSASELAVYTSDPFTASGPFGGPFTPSSATYTLSSEGGSSVAWSATASETWLTLSSAGGTIPSNSFTTLTATINSAANELSPGTYAATITIAGPGDPVELMVSLLVLSQNGGPIIVSTNVDVRTIITSGVPSAQTTNWSANSELSIYNRIYDDGTTNFQRTYLYFDLSNYVNDTVISDGTLELAADATYGGDVVGVTLGTTNASWTFDGITWDNQPSFIPVPGAINPSNGSYGEGSPVVWRIPKSVLQSWIKDGYNGLVLSADLGSRLHFHSSRDGHAPKLKFEVDGSGGGIAPGLPSLYLDTNGATPGSGGNSHVTWDNSAIWSVDAAGAAATSPWVVGAMAVFSAGNDAGPSTITVDGTQTIGGLAVEEGVPILTGGTLALTGSPTQFIITSIAQVDSDLSGIGLGFEKRGAGILSISGTKTYNEAITLTSGVLEVKDSGEHHGDGFRAPITSMGSSVVWLTADAGQERSDLRANITGTANVVKKGSGEVRVGTWSGVPTLNYSGSTTVEAGILNLQGQATGRGFDTVGPLNVASGAIFELTGLAAQSSDYAARFGALIGSGTILSGYQTCFLECGVGGGTGTFGGTLTNVGDSILSLIKSGTGMQTLTGDNSYSGTTTVAAGVLCITGSLANCSEVTVAVGATLSGSGTISGPITNSGTLSPGTSGPGELTVGSLTLAASSRLAFDLGDWTGSAGSGYDSINANSLNITATAANPVTVVVKPQSLVNFSNATRAFVLVSSPGGITDFAAEKFEVDASAFNSGSGQWEVQVSGTDLMLVYTVGGTPPSNAIPEISGITTPVRLTDGRIGLGFTASDAENNTLTCYIALRKSDGSTYVGNSDTLKGTIPSGSNTVYFTREELAGMTGLVSGSYQVRVRVLDAIHNTGQTCAEAFSPYFTITMPNQAPVIGQVGSPVQLPDGRIRCGFTATDPENNNMTCNIALRKNDGTTYVSNSDVPKGNISSGTNTLEFSLAEIANMTGLVSGSYQVRVRVFDSSHNTSATCAQVFSSYFTYTTLDAFNSYTAWASANAPGQTAAQDHDHDGVPNGIEYFMGASGSGFTANPTLINGTVTWPKSADFAGAYSVQTSTDLKVWTDVTTDPAQVTTTANSVIWTRSADPGNHFVRLVVQPN